MGIHQSERNGKPGAIATEPLNKEDYQKAGENEIPKDYPIMKRNWGFRTEWRKEVAC